jgi:hypothetical protein
LPFVDDRSARRLPPRQRAGIGAERLRHPFGGSFCRRTAEVDAARDVTDADAALHETICALSPGDAPTPIATTATSWATDPFVLGCYANIALGTEPEQHVADIETLGTPDGRILFAGEHTCELGTSTVDSAWLSGLREASRLLGRACPHPLTRQPQKSVRNAPRGCASLAVACRPLPLRW